MSLQADIEKAASRNVDGAVTLLQKLGWERQSQDFDGEPAGGVTTSGSNPRPLLIKNRGSQQCKAIVGRQFTTIYSLKPCTSEHNLGNSIAVIRTVSTSDIGAIRALALDVGGQR